MPGCCSWYYCFSKVLHPIAIIFFLVNLSTYPAHLFIVYTIPSCENTQSAQVVRVSYKIYLSHLRCLWSHSSLPRSLHLINARHSLHMQNYQYVTPLIRFHSKLQHACHPHIHHTFPLPSSILFIACENCYLSLSILYTQRSIPTRPMKNTAEPQTCNIISRNNTRLSVSHSAAYNIPR